MTFSKMNFLFALLLAMFLAATSTNAAEVDYEFRLGGTYSDNIRRSGDNELDQTVAVVGFKIDTSGESLRFEGNLSADVEYNDYLDDAFDESVFSTFNGSATFKLAPDTLHWIIEDRFGFLKRDPFGVDTPENRENINTFSTGPYLSVPMGNRTSLDLDGRYRITSFEISDSDNTALTGTLSVVRSLTPHRSLSLNVSAERVEFDNAALYGAFDRQSAYLGFNSRISRGDLKVNLGVNELHDEGMVFSGILASVGWSRKISNLSTVSLDYSRRFSDAGDFFRDFNNIGSQPGRGTEIIPIADSFENQKVSLGYRYFRNQMNFSVSAHYGEDDYQSASDFDSENAGITIRISRRLGANWSMGASGYLNGRRFPTSGRRDDYLDLNFNIDRNLTRTISLTFGYGYADRSSNLGGEDYAENRYTLLIRFVPGN